MLTQERLKELLHYDPDTGIFIWLVARQQGGSVGATAGYLNMGYRVIKIFDKKHKAHRLAWFYMTGKWPEADIDHIDMDRANNKFCNLREATRSQNCQNGPRRINNKSGFKGVCWHKKQKKWTAKICVNGKSTHLGYYGTPRQAANAYAFAASIMHKDFARVS